MAAKGKGASKATGSDATAVKTKVSLLAWAKAESRTGEELADACGQHIEVDRVIASHPRAAAALLSNLSHSTDRATRARVAANPATPAADMVRLGQQFPKEFLANPALDLMLLENPALMAQVSESFLVRLLKQADCPASLLTWAASHEQAKVQLAVVMNASAPEAALAQLRISPHRTVLEAVLARSGADAATPADPESEFRQALGRRLAGLSASGAYAAWKARDIGLPQWPFLSPSVRLYVLLVESVRLYVLLVEREPLVRSPYLPRALWEELASASDQYTPLMLCHLAISPAAPPEMLPSLLAKLVGHDDWDVRAEVARHPGLDAKSLELLLQDVVPIVVAAAARHPGVPVSDLRQLASAKHVEVRMSVASNPNAPLDLLEQLLNDDSARVRACACANDLVPAQEATRHLTLLHEMALEQDDRALAELIGSNPRASERQLSDLVAPNRSIEQVVAVARNPSAPHALLKSLAKRKNPDISFALAENPSVGTELLREMAMAPDNYVRVAALANPATPADVREATLKQIFSERPSSIDNVWTSHKCKRAPAAELEAAHAGDLLYFCGKDPNRAVLAKRPLAAVMALCAGPSVEPSRLVKVVSSTDWMVRAAVARNPGTPPNLIKKLTADVHPLVAALASRAQAGATAGIRGGNLLEAVP